MRTSRFFAAIVCLLFSSCGLREPVNPQISDHRVGLSDCPVHDEALIETTQMVNEARVSEHPLYWQLRDALFPAAFTPSADGEMAQIKYCRSCRIAKALCENDEGYEALYSMMSLDDASQAAQDRQVDAFIARQRQQLSRAMFLTPDELPTHR